MLDDELVSIEHPMLFDALYVPGPCCPAYGDAACSRATWDRLRAGLEVADAPKNRTRRIYVHRVVGHRTLLNEDALTAVFERRGFEVVDVAPLSLAARVELFRGAAAVATPIGAAAFNALFLAPGTRFYLVDDHRLPIRHYSPWWRAFLPGWSVDVRVLACAGSRAWPTGAPHDRSGWPTRVGVEYPPIHLPWMLPPDIEACIGGLFAPEDPMS